MNDEVTDERAQLLQRLREVLGPHFSTNSAVLSCLQLADIATLRSHVVRATRYESGQVEIYQKLHSSDEKTIRALKDWSTRTRPRNQPKRKFATISESRSSSPSKIPRPTTSADNPGGEFTRTASPPPKAKGKEKKFKGESSQQGGRSEDAKDACESRDNGECIITKTGSLVEKAHIFPYSLGQRPQDALTMFWYTLRNFWSKEKVAAWEKAVTGSDGTETCSNLMSLATHVHGAWAKTFFALKPISMSEDCKTMDVQVFWLEQNSFVRSMDLVPGKLGPADLCCGPKKFKLLDCETNGLIRSGHLITISTDDPELRPLPSMALLEMQWVLHRALAMSGAAEASEDDYYESDDDASAGDLQEVEEGPIAELEPPGAAPRQAGENVPLTMLGKSRRPPYTPENQPTAETSKVAERQPVEENNPVALSRRHPNVG